MRVLDPMRFVVLIGLLSLAMGAASANVKVHNLFSDNMVLQQGIDVPVWGEAPSGETVTVQFRGQKVSTVAENGKWTVRLKPTRAGGPFAMKITGANTIELKHVMVGEVWICSGQSNMDFILKTSKGGEETSATAAGDDIRLFKMPFWGSPTPKYDVDASWQVSGKENSLEFSAVGYYFGKYLKSHTNVPIGLIHCAMGATGAECWMSEDMLRSDKRFADTYLSPSFKPFFEFCQPMAFYNGMLCAVIPYGIRGAIWYQGESNCDRAYLYRDMFPALIKGWREKWGQGDFPFYFVQLANFNADERGPEPGDSLWAECREAQSMAVSKVKNSGMAVIIDVGDPHDIHPKNKKPVGERLALLALGQTYKKRIECQSPVYKSLKIKGERAQIRFSYAYSGLKTTSGAPRGFAIAGDDHKFVWAEAKITGKDTVEVWSPSVAEPVAVRYGWANSPELNLYNSADLPASPFRTDDFPILTQPKD